AIALPGVGNRREDNANPHSLVRTVNMYLYALSQDPYNLADTPIEKDVIVYLDTKQGDLTYGYFINPKASLGSLKGQYQVFLKINQYLREQVISPRGNSVFSFAPMQVTPL